MSEGMGQFLDPEVRKFPMGLEVIINNSAFDSGTEVGVVEENETQMFHAKVNWSPRIGDDGAPVYPTRGDHGILIVSDMNTPWLVDWTPSE